MSENKYTPEPWRIELVNHALGDTGDYEGVVEIRAGDAKRPMIEIWSDSDEAEANASRIVACVNACAGIDTELLEIIADNDKTLAGVIANVEKQRDELLAVLEKCRKELSAWMRDHGDDIATQEAVADARAAIASVKESK